MNSPGASFSQLNIILLNILKHIDLILIAPEGIFFRVLFLNELVIGDVGGEEGVLIGLVGTFGDVTETGTELVLCVFSRDEAAVARDLCAWV